MTVQSSRTKSCFIPKRWYSEHPELGEPGRIPVEPFISVEQFLRERERLWPKVWLKVARVEDIPSAGDYIVKDIPPTDSSLLIVRGRDNEVRAFHNVCPHRGSPLCWEKSGETGSTSAIKCPFHGFTFDLSGNLRFIPDEENFYNVDKGQYGLKMVLSEIWNGFIFVHLDPHPSESLGEFLGEVGERLSAHPFHDYTHYYEYRAVMKCNWKTMIGGFLENYHTATLHHNAAAYFTTSENPFSRNLLVQLGKRHRLISMFGNPDEPATPVGKIAFSHGTGFIKATADKENTPGAVNPTKSDNWSFDLNNIFPNFQLNVVNGAWYTHSFWPTGPEEMIWETRLYFSKPTNASERFFQEYSKVTVRDVLLEDGTLTENVQKSLRSGVLDHMILQDEEIAIQHFNHVVQSYTSQESERIGA